MPIVIAVALGGAVGAVLRYGMVSFMPMWGSFPVAVLIANIIGSTVFGWLVSAIDAQIIIMSEGMRSFIMVGIIGAFTTFSFFSFETVSLFQSQGVKIAILYIFLSVSLAITGFVIGAKLATAF